MGCTKKHLMTVGCLATLWIVAIAAGQQEGSCPGQGDCCVPGGNGTPGCDDFDCCDLICSLDPFCCNTFWDGICADSAADLCLLCGDAGVENDNCENAIPIANGPTPFSNDGATDDGPAPCGLMGSDIWYTYDATFNGDLAIDTCGSGFDTVVAVYDGCGCSVEGGGGQVLACNDDCGGVPCPPLQSCVLVPVVSGNCYLIQVGGFGGSQGSGVINIEKLPGTPTGGCCQCDGALQFCTIETEDDCEVLGGLYLGDDTSCDPEGVTSPCEVAYPNQCVGACCFDDGTCAELTEDDCFDQGGTFNGLGTFCEAGLCPCTVELVADGGSSDTALPIGTVTTQYNPVDGTWTVTYETTGTWMIQATHLHLACDVKGFPLTGSGNPKVGQFDYKSDHAPFVSSVEWVVDDPGCCPAPTLFGAHAKVIDADGRKESAWGAGVSFPGNNWATYFICNCGE